MTGGNDGPINMSRKRDPDFCLHLSVSCKPIILLGVGLFLPHGENIRGNLLLTGIVNNNNNNANTQIKEYKLL